MLIYRRDKLGLGTKFPRRPRERSGSPPEDSRGETPRTAAANSLAGKRTPMRNCRRFGWKGRTFETSGDNVLDNRALFSRGSQKLCVVLRQGSLGVKPAVRGAAHADPYVFGAVPLPPQVLRSVSRSFAPSSSSSSTAGREYDTLLPRVIESAAIISFLCL